MSNQGTRILPVPDSTEVVRSALPEGAATEAKQDTQITFLTSIDGKDFATESTLGNLLTSSTANGALLTTIDASLTSIDGKVATEATLLNIATSAGNLDSDRRADVHDGAGNAISSVECLRTRVRIDTLENGDVVVTSYNTPSVTKDKKEKSSMTTETNVDTLSDSLFLDTLISLYMRRRIVAIAAIDTAFMFESSRKIISQNRYGQATDDTIQISNAESLHVIISNAIKGKIDNEFWVIKEGCWVCRLCP